MPVTVDKSSIVISEKQPEKEKPEVKPVIHGEVKVKKKSFIKKVVDAMAGRDVGDVGDYLLYDIFVPGVKNLFYDLVTGGLGAYLYDERRVGGGNRQNLRRDRGTSYVSYNTVGQQRNYARPNRRSTHNFDDLLFANRDDAEEVLSNLVDFVEIYGKTTVSDLYDLVGKTGDFTDRGFGWTELGSSRVIRGRDGYLLDLPPVQALYN